MAARRPSVGEETLAGDLAREGYRFEREWRFDPSRKWRADFYLPDHGVLVEVDGLVFRGRGRHQSAIGAEGDNEKKNRAIELGYTVLCFSQRQVAGTAVRGKKKIPMKRAIEVINDICRGGGDE